jgi:hypothetical protein
MMFFKYPIVALALAGLSLQALADERSDDSALAIRYMEAMVRGEFDAAADLLAPSVMEQFKKMIVDKVRGANDAEAKAILREAGYGDLASLESVSAREFFVRQSRRMRPLTDAMMEKLRNVRVKVVFAEGLADGKSRLNLMLFAPGVPDQPATVVIGVVDGNRMVIGL